MCLLEYYARNYLIERVENNPAMLRHRDAYLEALEKMFEKIV